MQALRQQFSVDRISELRASPKGRAAVRARVAPRSDARGVGRREAVGIFSGSLALLAGAQRADAAYGDAARVFAGRPTNVSGFTPYAAEDFALLIPSKWEPSKERDFPTTVFRYQDSFAAANNMIVNQEPVTVGSIQDLGSIDRFLQDRAYLFGDDSSWAGESRSEGGFQPNSIAASSILEEEEATDKKGRTVYRYHVLSRASDGDEGGRHQLVAATVANSKLYIFKVQVGDKRWFRGENKNAETAWNSFTVA